MGFISRVLEQKSFVVNRQPGQELTGLSSSLTHTGLNIDNDKALTYSAYWACVRILSETLASFPLFLMRETHVGKEKARDRQLFNLLHQSPNPEMPAFAFIETMQHHVVTWGNGYALIDWDDSLEPQALWLMCPDRVTPERDRETKALQYKYYPMDNSGPIILPSYRVLHIPGLGFDGLNGYSVLHIARQAIALGLAEEQFGAEYFGQGTNLGAVAKVPGKLSREAHDQLKKDLSEKYAGLGKTHRLLILTEGMTFDKTTIPPEDSQFLESRKFQIGDVARWFLMQPHRIGDLDRATFSNIEHQSLEFVMYTMRPWAIRWEQWLNFKLLAPVFENEYFKFNLSALLRGDIQSRYSAYAIGLQNGWLSPNDVRELEDMNPILGQGGDTYMRQVNMQVASQNGPTPVKSIISP